MSNLKPCPFCGESDNRNRGKYPVQRTCNICGAEGPETYPSNKADEVWNHRPLQEALETRVRKLETEKAEKEKKLTWLRALLRQAWQLYDANGESFNRSGRCEALEEAMAFYDENFERNKILEAKFDVPQGVLNRWAVLDKIRLLESELAQAQAAAVQWVTYDGTQDTLPPLHYSALYAPVKLEHLSACCIATLLVEKGNLTWVGHRRWVPEIGDRWAYIPELPKEADHA